LPDDGQPPTAITAGIELGQDAKQPFPDSKGPHTSSISSNRKLGPKWDISGPFFAKFSPAGNASCAEHLEVQEIIRVTVFHFSREGELAAGRTDIWVWLDRL
jgi:hypothetical protein